MEAPQAISTTTLRMLSRESNAIVVEVAARSACVLMGD